MTYQLLICYIDFRLINKVPHSYINSEFFFLNISKKYINKINWDEQENGLLWGFHLNYFDFLLQDNLSKEEGIRLLYDYINRFDTNSVGKHPYTISLRGMNWIKFLSLYQINDRRINAHLLYQFNLLKKRCEYNLLGK